MPGAASPSRIAGLVLLALVVAVGVWRVVPAFDLVDEQLDSTRGLTRLERELAPARAIDVGLSVTLFLPFVAVGSLLGGGRRRRTAS